MPKIGQTSLQCYDKDTEKFTLVVALVLTVPLHALEPPTSVPIIEILIKPLVYMKEHYVRN